MTKTTCNLHAGDYFVFFGRYFRATKPLAVDIYAKTIDLDDSLEEIKKEEYEEWLEKQAVYCVIGDHDYGKNISK